jgi:2-succinyl-5-enolpyruvyl-6-hydroxy-3-cyclohexene-1-carboxylate synthase
VTNVAWAKALLDKLFASGVDEIIFCPGARNAPFVELLSKWENAKAYSFFEERSAGFFALGRAAATGKPKAVITTSGTAVANLLPAVIEAHYAGIPLVVVSADRPKTYRGTGAPQTIEQPGIFSSYAVSLGDVAVGEMPNLHLFQRGPSHLNVCFDEPLLDEPVLKWKSTLGVPTEDEKPAVNLEPFKKFSQQLKKPLILVGGLPEDIRKNVCEWLHIQSCPVYLEACSGLRGARELSRLEIRAGTKSLRSHLFDGVLRIGGVPTTRLWRDLEQSEIPVLSVSELPFTGLSQGRGEILELSKDLLSRNVQFKHEALSDIIDLDRENLSRLEQLLVRFPLSEPGLFRALSKMISPTDGVYLGNSLPIREWDLAARQDICFENCFANRGANGIDGQLSTFFGWASTERMNWCLTGDLTTMYDLAAPWAARQRQIPQFHLVVINNGGGRIFKPMFKQPFFENQHQLSFRDWAKMWDLPYMLWDGHEHPRESGVIEVQPDLQQTEAFLSLW